MAIYRVSTPKGDRFVEATTKAAAVNHCIDKNEYSVEALSPSAVAKWAKEGVDFESALPSKAA